MKGKLAPDGTILITVTVVVNIEKKGGFEVTGVQHPCMSKVDRELAANALREVAAGLEAP